MGILRSNIFFDFCLGISEAKMKKRAIFCAFLFGKKKMFSNSLWLMVWFFFSKSSCFSSQGINELRRIKGIVKIGESQHPAVRLGAPCPGNIPEHFFFSLKISTLLKSEWLFLQMNMKQLQGNIVFNYKFRNLKKVKDTQWPIWEVPSWLSGLRIQYCHCCGSVSAVAQVRSLTQEFTYALGMAPQKSLYETPNKSFWSHGKINFHLWFAYFQIY